MFRPAFSSRNCDGRAPRFILALVLALIATYPAASFLRAQEATVARRNYVHHLQLADRVRVTVYNEDDLTAIARIDSRGRIVLPLVGEVDIGGLTIMEAQKKIEASYRDGRYLRNPQVTINVEEYALREVSINGAVRSPGRYALPVESTYSLVELVTKAGGFTDTAKGTAVTVTRFDKSGGKQVFVIDVESIIKGRKSGRSEDNSFLLEAGDIVNVPESLI